MAVQVTDIRSNRRQRRSTSRNPATTNSLELRPRWEGGGNHSLSHSKGTPPPRRSPPGSLTTALCIWLVRVHSTDSPQMAMGMVVCLYLGVTQRHPQRGGVARSLPLLV